MTHKLRAATAICALIAAALSACGHYGAPVRAERARGDAAAAPVTQDADRPDDTERDRHD